MPWERKAMVWRTVKSWSLWLVEELLVSDVMYWGSGWWAYAVFPSWRVRPLTIVLRATCCGSGMAVAETRTGPRGVESSVRRHRLRNVVDDL